MTNSIDWRSSDVEDGTLTVAFDSEPDFAFLKTFDMVLIEAPESSEWGRVQVAGGRVVVEDVRPDAAASLRAFLDSAVAEAEQRVPGERERMAAEAEAEREAERRRKAEADAAEAALRRQDEQLESDFRG